MPLKLPVKTKSQQLIPSAAVKSAYDLKLTPEATERLKAIEECREYLTEQAQIASAISIKDDMTNVAAAEVVVNLTKARKATEDLQKYFTSPLEQAKKAVIAVFKKIGEDAIGQEERLRKEAGDYFMKKENARREEEQRRLAKQREDERSARALGRSAPPPMAAAPAPEVARSTATENGALGIKLKWGFDVVDLAQVPREFLCLDEKKVRAAIIAGTRTIAGLTISERPETAVR